MEVIVYIPTKASALHEDAKETFEKIIYVERKSKRTVKSNDFDKECVDNKSKPVDDERKGIDIKRARREIIKFGINGFDPAKKQEAKTALAISLGAKPPKKDYKNYKEMLQEKKDQKLQEKSEQAMMQAGKNAVGVCISSKNFENKLKNKQRIKTNKDLLSGYGKATLQSNVPKSDLKKGNQNKIKKGNISKSGKQKNNKK